ncbi:tRNA (adenosine(37)-N6)-threonylcarbamoyltransferase complex transferase subunit TsaD [Patescibacteria group bacterium]|nr:tRNA (adenosine(37)-N6)-threonylcarbamoyltransferase complex transferase subunit TsaD [Patescibacteria group bacterium]
MKNLTILAIETSCDETSCSIVVDGIYEVCTSTATSADMHEKTGGVVPEIAARKQLESIAPVLQDCMQAYCTKKDIPFASAREFLMSNIDAIAVTVGPGLIGSLLVGVEASKTLALLADRPLIAVNHLVGHIYANFLDNPEILKLEESGDLFPAVVLVVSGGHTDLVLMQGHNDLKYLGGTLDDAAGEAFDKVARLLGLAKYLGGVQVSTQAALCVDNTLKGKLPRPMLGQPNFDFSFSGLKTAVRKLIEDKAAPVDVICCEFEAAVCDVLVKKTMKAVQQFNAKSVLLGGGVSANSQLRARIGLAAKEHAIPVFMPPIRLCGDSAAYIASAAYFKNSSLSIVGNFDNFVVDPSLGILD